MEGQKRADEFDFERWEQRCKSQYRQYMKTAMEAPDTGEVVEEVRSRMQAMKVALIERALKEDSRAPRSDPIPDADQYEQPNVGWLARVFTKW